MLRLEGSVTNLRNFGLVRMWYYHRDQVYAELVRSVARTRVLYRHYRNTVQRSGEYWDEVAGSLGSKEDCVTMMSRQDLVINITTGEIYFQDWNIQCDEVASVETRLLVKALVDHQAMGDQIIKGLKARGINLPGMTIQQNYLGGWNVGSSVDELIQEVQRLTTE